MLYRSLDFRQYGCALSRCSTVGSSDGIVIYCAWTSTTVNARLLSRSDPENPLGGNLYTATGTSILASHYNLTSNFLSCSRPPWQRTALIIPCQCVRVRSWILFQPPILKTMASEAYYPLKRSLRPLIVRRLRPGAANGAWRMYGGPIEYPMCKVLA